MPTLMLKRKLENEIFLLHVELLLLYWRARENEC